jgi:hypothetical protein
MANTVVNWWSLLKRKEYLQKIMGESPIATWPVVFQGGRQSLPVYSVPLDMPCYRLSNGRTAARQMQFIELQKRQGVIATDDFFSGDPDYLPALQAQHDILKDMVSACGLLATLQIDAQREPLFVDRSGYVVNGNRRLCAMRKLFTESPETYSRFEHVEIAVLPPCAPEEIEELEADLQIAEDTKMEYSWVNRALLLRKRRAQGWDSEKISAFYKIVKEDVNQLLLMLDYADRYLESRSLAKLYEKVEVHEQAFKEIVTQRQRNILPTALDKEAFAEVSFLFLDTISPGRNYDKIKALARRWPQVLPELTSELRVSDTGPEQPLASGEDDPINQLIGEAPFNPIVTNPQLLLKSLSGEAGRNVAREIVLDRLESIARTEKERRIQQSCATLIQHAQTFLRDALVQLHSGIEASEVDAVRNQLEQTTSLVAEIRQILDE